jgi:hypothetical protein
MSVINKTTRTPAPVLTTTGPETSSLPVAPVAAQSSASVDQLESVSVVKASAAPAPEKRVKVFYRWTSEEEATGLTTPGGLTLGNIRQYIDNDANFLGDGIYMAESPITAQMYGDSLVEIWVDESLVEDGKFAHFGGIGRDWWLGQIDEVVEAKGVDLGKLDSNEYTEYGDAAALLSECGVYYRPFTGAALDRKELEVLASYSEDNKGAVFQKELDNRSYQWSTDASGKLSAIEYSAAGYAVGPLAKKYCTKANQASFKAYTGETSGDASQYQGLKPVGFDNDLKALSKKNIIYKLWVLWKTIRAAIVGCFTGR